MQSFAAVLKGLQVETMIRGFATSVSNYQPFGAPCSSGAFSIDGEGHVTLNCRGAPCLMAEARGGIPPVLSAAQPHAERVSFEVVQPTDTRR